MQQQLRGARTWAHPFTPLVTLRVGAVCQYCGSETGDAESVYVCPLPLIPLPPLWTTPNLLFPSTVGQTSLSNLATRDDI